MSVPRWSSRVRLPAIAALCFSSASLAGGVQNVTVAQLTLYTGSTATGAIVKISPASPSGLTGCSYTAGDYVWIDFSAQVIPSGGDVYATVLAAQLAGKTLGFGTTGCNASGIPIVYGVNVNP